MPDINDVTILLVEDDPGHARLIEKNLRRANVTNEVVFATNGQEALDTSSAKGSTPATIVHLTCWYCSTSTCRCSTAIRSSCA